MQADINNTTPVLVIVTALLATAFPACSQSKYACQQVYVYSQAVFPGNIRVNKDGGQAAPNIDASTFVYIETKGNTLPPWNIAWKKGIAYNITLIPVTGDSAVVGRQETTMQQLVIKPHKGNSLWRVQFNAPQEVTRALPTLMNDSTREIVLGEKFTNKKIFLPLGRVTQLEPERRP